MNEIMLQLDRRIAPTNYLKYNKIHKSCLFSKDLNKLCGLLLSHVFVKTRSLGYVLRVASIDGIAEPNTKEKNEKRINVDVVNSIVKKSWIG